ncbi:DUF4919 domain-containing protein [Lacihabitans soyangensis]|nr:DUF4919 domain-containing protein [Lacihabitans soyangensis]
MKKLIVVLITISSLANAQSINFSYKKDYTKYISDTKNSSSNYYFPKLKERISNYDTTLTKSEILHILIASTEIENDIEELESKEYEIFESSEKKEFNQSIELSKKLLIKYPWNLTAHKELSYALKSNGDSLSNDYKKHYQFFRKITESYLTTGNGNFESPMFSVTFMDAFQIMNGYFRCKPTTKQMFFENQTKDILYACQCYSSTYDQIFTKYFYLTHFKNYYGKFIEQLDDSKENINGYTIETVNGEDFKGKVFTQFDEVPFLFEEPNDLKDYIIKNLKYPSNQYLSTVNKSKTTSEYTISLKFVVTSKGELKNFQIASNDLDRKYAEIAINFLRNTKKWNPAKINGKAIDSLTSISIPFYF